LDEDLEQGPPDPSEEIPPIDVPPPDGSEPR
jgi:hypothetical protein